MATDENAMVRALKCEVVFEGWRRADLEGKKGEEGKRQGKKAQKNGLWYDLARARGELTSAANRLAAALWAVRQKIYLRPDKVDGKKVSDRTLAYQGLSGKWQPQGRPLYSPQGPRLAGGVLAATANLVCERLANDYRDIMSGAKSLSTFVALPFGFRNCDIRVDGERGMVVLTLWAQESGRASRLTVRPIGLDKDRGSREVFRRICRGEYVATGAKLSHNERDRKWYLSLGWKTDSPPVPREGLVCGVDLRFYARAFLRYVDPATGEVLKSRDMVKVPETTVRAWVAVESERSARSHFNRDQYGQRVGHGRARKFRVVDCLTDRRSRIVDSAIAQCCAAIVAQAKARGASTIVVENLTGFTDDKMDETEGLRGRERAKQRKRFLSWQQGGIRRGLPAVCEAAGIRFLEENPAYSSRTCSVCGEVYKDGPEKHPPFGLVTYSRFECRCGNKSFAPWNAASNIAQKGLRHLSSDK